MKTIGPLTALIYALLMTYAYGSQIYNLFETKNTSGLSLNFFLFALVAVMLRTSMLDLLS